MKSAGCLGVVVAALCLSLPPDAAAAPNRPNVVLIITDDQGYGDIAAHGNPIIKTPHLDALHGESVRFTNFHVDPTCSPTRAALLTGKYAHRVKVWHTIAGGNHLRAGEATMADVFKASGYRTGMFGKWHLGSNYPYRPMDRGFDEWLGQGDGGTGTTDDYFTNDRVNDHYLHNGDWEQRAGWAPDVFFDAAIEFIKRREVDKPFFVYVSTYVPHHPWTVPDRAWAKEYEAEAGAAAYFLSSIERVDRAIGRLRTALADEELADNTIVIFVTDNGGTGGVRIFNAGMRGRKGSVYEGGHRVPLFIHWPAGRIEHGADVQDLNAHIDLLPTLIDLCGLTPPPAADFDGRSFRRQLYDPSAALPPRTLCVELQRTHQPLKWRNAAAMTNQWRLVNATELYHITEDPGQENNVYDDHPEVVAKLKRDFDAYWRRVTPGDRDRARNIVGHRRDPETYLHSSDWYLPNTPWNHAMVARGAEQAGTWLIAAAQPGAYRFELRRWPREADAPITGVPSIDKAVDAWAPDGGKPFLVYSGEEAPFQALPVRFMRLRVGDHEEIRAVGEADTRVAFAVTLEQRDYEVRAEMLDADKRVLAGAYYVYCRKLP